jgi:hypothetical protein
MAIKPFEILDMPEGESFYFAFIQGILKITNMSLFLMTSSISVSPLITQKKKSCRGRMNGVSSGMLHCVALVRTDVSENLAPPSSG